MVRPVEMTVALVDTAVEAMVTQVRVLPPDDPYPHWVVAAADASWEEETANKLPMTRDSKLMTLAGR
jgi:hypothetical protein